MAIFLLLVDIQRCVVQKIQDTSSCNQWKCIGRKLDLSSEFLSDLEQSAPRCSQELLSMCLQKWYAENSSAPTTTLLQQLSSTTGNHLKNEWLGDHDSLDI